MRFLICLMLFVSLALPLWGQTTKDVSTFGPEINWLQIELKKMGLPQKFIKASLETYETESFETVIKLNTLGFLQPPQHMDRVTAQSVEETARFIKDNQKLFEKAEKKYKVPASVISALLWIETRHGEDRGRFHTLSVFLHLLQAQRKPVQEHLYKLAIEKNLEKKEFTEKEIRAKIKEKTKWRSEWAREEIRALARISKEKKLDLRALKGSFAGAFGLPQFIPSSYRNFAKAIKAKMSPDLTTAGDAIMSVAHYLVKHGWSNKKKEAKIQALMKYNNSRDYADSILEISKRVASPNL